MKLRFIIILTVLANTTFANASSLEDFVIEQLKCETEPKILPILLSLEKTNKIKSSEMLGFDSISCFRIHGGIKVMGMTFVSVCGHEENDQVRKKRPDLLWRGPGTSPGQFISFGTHAVYGPTQEWYFSNIGKKYLNQAINTEYTNLGDQTEVSCSSNMIMN